MRASCTAALALFIERNDARVTYLNNTRCHNDVGQYHDVASYLSCPAVCMEQSAAPVFSFCAPSTAKDCPVPNGTCWCYEDAGDCETDAGWISGISPAPAPVPPPADWADAISRGDMKYTSDTPELIGEGYFPVLANGFVGIEAGPFTQIFENSWPWRDAGSFKLQGVYNGFNYLSPSHRAQIPKISDVTIFAPAGANISAQGCAIDFSRGVYYNRTLVNSGVLGCADGTVIEQRSYAHRSLRELFVFELRAFSSTGDAAWVGCTVPVVWSITPAIPALNDTALEQTLEQGAPAVWAGTTLFPEENGLPLRSIAVVFDAWAAAGPSSLTFTPAAPLLSVRAVLRSDLDVPSAQTVADVAAAARTTFDNYTALSPAELLASHEDAMAALWSSGIELTGNTSLAANVNASFYDIISSLRADLNWSTSPGGLATGAYSSHAFWDDETWMLPVLSVLFPDLARAALQYRLDRLPASMTNALLMNYSGAKFAWESGYTGLWASPWRGADFSEDHLNADVPLMFRRFFFTSGDKTWLASAWPQLNASCTFWECRFQRTDSTGPAPVGYPSGCSPKNGVGNWTVKRVIPPDESRGVVDDEVYTNAAGAQTLAWCVTAAAELDIPAALLPPLWSVIAAAPYLPLDDTLYKGGPVHRQNQNYSGQTINQADVVLMQYPLGLDFGEDQNQRDLDYYSTVTDFAGMFTGDSSYACAYLALGNRSAADAQLLLAFDHIEPHFDVFHETAHDDGHSQHFITGNGGFLQTFLFGYAGLRVERLGVLTFASQAPLLPPLGVTAVKLRGLHLLGAAFDFVYDAEQICVSLQPDGAAGSPLELRVLASGQRLPVGGAPVCVAVQPVAVAGVGFA